MLPLLPATKDAEGEGKKLESDRSEDDDLAEELTFWQQIKKEWRAFKRELVQEVKDYGPPYVDNASLLPDDLKEECALLRPKLLKIHNLLNMRANPNTPDEDDLYYTPLHWCARRNHLQAAQMLIEAHANVNAVTEFGHTPLHLAAMFKPPDAKSKKLSRFPLIQLLVENGADVNVRDKGGFSALDFAARNQDLRMVKYLLDRNARCTLDPQYLVTGRDHILSFCIDPEVYRLIKATLDKEQALIEAEERRKAEERQRLVDEEKARLVSFFQQAEGI